MQVDGLSFDCEGMARDLKDYEQKEQDWAD
jgi:hypothetical protein